MYKKLGEKTTFMLASLTFAVGLLHAFVASDLTQLILLSIVPGIGVGGIIMSEPLMSVFIDCDETKTGRGREAMYWGILTFVSRLALALTAMTQFVVQTTTGFIPDMNAVQPPGAIGGLRMMLSLFPPVAVFLGVLVFIRFPLTKAEVSKIRVELEEIHEEKRRKLQKLAQATT